MRRSKAPFWALIVMMNLARGPSKSVDEDTALDHRE